MDRNLQLLGIARKAGLLAVGGDSAAIAVRNGKARAVFSASDASEGAKRRAYKDSGNYGVLYVVIPYTKFELGIVTGRGSPGTLAILDTGLAAGFLGGLAKKEPELYGEMAELLAESARTLAGNRKNTAGVRRTAQ